MKKSNISQKTLTVEKTKVPATASIKGPPVRFRPY